MIVEIAIAGDCGVGKTSIIHRYTTGSFLDNPYIGSHFQEYTSTNTLYCVCVCYIQHGSELYMCYIAFELQTIEKMQPIINSFLVIYC